MQIRLWKEMDRLANPGQSTRNQLLRQFDDMFNQLMGPTTWAETTPEFAPSYDIQEADDRYWLSFDIPGVDRNDLSIEIEGNRLTVSGERKGDTYQGSSASRRSRYGRFQQVFTIPDGVSAEAVEANCKDGVLTLSIPKPATARTQKIKIGDGSDKESSAKGNFFKSLVGDKKGSKESAVDVKQESVTMAN